MIRSVQIDDITLPPTKRVLPQNTKTPTLVGTGLFSRHFFWNTLVLKWDGRIKVILTDPATGHSDGISCQRDPRSQGSSWCHLKKTSNFKLLATQDCSDFFSVT